MKKQWTSNEDLKNYCIKKWDETLKLACISDDNYIKIIYHHIDEIDKHSNKNKQRWRFSERIVIIFTSAVALLNVVATVVPSEIAVWINIIAAIWAALVSIANGIKSTDAYKETWLRYSKSRSKLDMECQRFATNIKDYADIDNDPIFSGEEAKAKAKIQRFKINTTIIIQEDYDAFFFNMNKD